MSDSDNIEPASVKAQLKESPQSPISVQSDNEEEFVTSILHKNKRRRQPQEDGDDEETMIDELIKEMLQAAEDDDQANSESLPALNKLKMLNRVSQFLKVAKFHDLFLAMEGCVILSRWLSPLPDGSIPCNMIRQSLLEALQELPISTENLQHCDLGKQVMAIFKQPHESAAMKKMAKALIDKWSRAIYEINIDYTSLEDSERHLDNRTARITESNMHRVIAQDTPTNFIRVPMRGMHDFKHRPISRLSQPSDKQEQDSSALHSLQKKMLKRKRPTGRKSTGQMSVDGKGLLF